MRCGSAPVRSLCFIAAAVFFAKAETAVLECVADGASAPPGWEMRAREIPTPATILLDFRMWNIQSWIIQKATLLLHTAGGALPVKVEVAPISEKWSEDSAPANALPNLKYVPATVQVAGGNWLQIQVPPALVQEMAGARAHGFALRTSGGGSSIHTRESVVSAPYLIVSGTRK